MEDTPSELLRNFLICYKGFGGRRIDSLPLEAFASRVFLPIDASFFNRRLIEGQVEVLPPGIGIDFEAKHFVVSLDELDYELMLAEGYEIPYFRMGFVKLLDEIMQSKKRQSLVFDLGPTSVILNFEDIDALHKRYFLEKIISVVDLDLGLGLRPE